MNITKKHKKIIQIDNIHIESVLTAGVRLSMARVDECDGLASGNKSYKLRPILASAKKKKIRRLLSFGGAYSNHIHALALMANQHNFKTTAIIRGEADYANNPTLTDAQAAGMMLEFVSRKEYQQRNDKTYLNALQQRFPDTLIIPEGGSSQLAISGCANLTRDVNASHMSDILTIACGTGASLAGVVCGLSNSQKALGYAVLKDQTLNHRINRFIKHENRPRSRHTLINADFGGYAKLDSRLLDFILKWLDQTGILLDPIYTSKMCMRLMQQIAAGEFLFGTSITMIHSGGLQAWRGMQSRVLALAGQSSWETIERFLESKN